MLLEKLALSTATMVRAANKSDIWKAVTNPAYRHIEDPMMKIEKAIIDASKGSGDDLLALQRDPKFNKQQLMKRIGASWKERHA